MKFISMLEAVGAVAALPASQPQVECKNPEKRIEWRQMDPKDQKSYLDAVLCLKTKPSKIGLNSTLYDDFPHVHFKLNDYIHGGAPFLPWHRYFSYVYLKNLREECGYKGPGTYWDWTLDTKGLRFSPVMSGEHNFGGDGSTNRTEVGPAGDKLRCVNDGPFSKVRLEWLGVNPKKMLGGGHCLFRKLPEVSEPEAFAINVGIFGPENVADVQARDTWDMFHWDLEGGPHGVIHASLGGEMNPTTSPNEPLFFLHHPQIDRLWWQWQQKNETRLTEYYGPANHVGENDSREVDLDDVLPMNGLAEDITVREVMDVSKHLCYTY